MVQSFHWEKDPHDKLNGDKKQNDQGYTCELEKKLSMPGIISVHNDSVVEKQR
jgi:hypothetical protein